MNRQLLAVVLSCASAMTVGGCQGNSDEGDDVGDQDQGRLQALLRDAPLTQLSGASASPREDRLATAPPTRNVILPGTNPTGVWDFDDCNSFRTNLNDSFSINTAFRSVGVACTTGVDNTPAVAIAVKEDIVYVPDQPDFTFGSGVTVAGWFKPNATGGVRTLFRKRDKDTSSFALLLNSGRFEFVIGLGAGVALSVT
jgi:hypothetical protein